MLNTHTQIKESEYDQNIYISCCNEIEYLLKYLYIYISLLPKKLCIYSYKILRAIYNNI